MTSHITASSLSGKDTRLIDSASCASLQTGLEVESQRHLHDTRRACGCGRPKSCSGLFDNRSLRAISIGDRDEAEGQAAVDVIEIRSIEKIIGLPTKL